MLSDPSSKLFGGLDDAFPDLMNRHSQVSDPGPLSLLVKCAYWDHESGLETGIFGRFHIKCTKPTNFLRYSSHLFVVPPHSMADTYGSCIDQCHCLPQQSHSCYLSITFEWIRQLLSKLKHCKLQGKIEIGGHQQNFD